MTDPDIAEDFAGFYAAIEALLPQLDSAVARVEGANSDDARMNAAVQVIMLAEEAAASFAPMIAALEAQRATLVETAKGGRKALAAAMANAGCLRFTTEMHTVSLADGAQRLEVTDEAAIPSDLWTDPKPNVGGIREALRRGRDVPGVRLANGEAGVRIALRKEKLS